MIYRIKKGTELHNRVLIFIGESDKWIIIISLINDIFDCDITNIGWYPKLNKIKSLKINYENLPEDKKEYFNDKGWLLPNNKYYNKWVSVVDKINLHSIEDNYMNRFLLPIFINPKIFLDTSKFDLLIKIDELKDKDSSNVLDYIAFERFYEKTNLEEFPNYDI